MKFTMRRATYVLIGFLVLVIALLAVQASAKNRSNPPVVGEPQWDSAETQTLAQRACFDCHSNQTQWSIYSGLPLVGGLIADHVVEGRSRLNFSEWNAPGREQEADEAGEKAFEPMHYAEEDVIPQPPYSWFHPKARLTTAEREQLAAGFRATFGGEANDRSQDVERSEYIRETGESDGE